ncbi:YdcF family protein [Reinekea blandensis]|uniref:DUF218 domain-containing protein n=1 Tax=Reinekea blandensis MED297 TaxID=314283 RepID=A4BKN7_9GAMM|nr:YdcF family protein [Reinekea blandensis]EAR07316.1 hypothetical protein MED297_12227 [Reinekea sp. MED297] [Reinekea blandensis MED297]
MDDVFFLLSKLLWGLVSPSGLLLSGAFLAWFLRSRLPRVTRWLSVLVILALLLIGFYPVGAWLVYPLEHRFKPPNTEQAPDGIIVLGGAWRTQSSVYWGQWELNHAAERDLAMLALARRFPEAELVFTGGSGKLFSQQFKEADVARQLYSDLGLNPVRVQFESESRNTYENARFSQKLINPDVADIWWLVTSAYHMTRATEVFCGIGWRVVPYPVDHFYEPGSWRPNWAFADHLWELERVSREWLGLWVYRATGRAERGCT